MDNACFVCPIYDSKNHFDFGYDLFKSKLDLGIEEKIYFVFSDEGQKDKFANEINKRFSSKIDYLILPSELLHYKSKVVVKKFYALHELMDKYDYISLIDCETIFVNKTNFYELFKYIDDNSLCLNSNISYDGYFVLRKCFMTMGLYDNKTLKKEFSNYKYNFWFNEIQVYNSKLLPGFFSWLEQFDKEAYLNEWNCFEYYIYGAYLILEKGYHIKKFRKLKSMGGIMEYLPMYSVEKQKKIIKMLNTHWTSSKETINENIYLQFHLDRKDGEDYGYKANRFVLSLKRYYHIILNK